MELNKAINIDCIRGLKGVGDASVDLIVADPPFNVGKNYGGFTDDRKPPSEYWDWMREWIHEAYRILKPDSAFYCFHTDDGIFKLRPIVEEQGFIFRQVLIWHHPNGWGGPQMLGPHCTKWNYRHEMILLSNKGEAVLRQDSPWFTTVLKYPIPQSNFKEGREHPAQKPIGLYETILRRHKGTLFVDPHCGSGSSLVAAKRLSWNFIGFDINPQYVEIANRRLAAQPIKLTSFA